MKSIVSLDLHTKKNKLLLKEDRKKQNHPVLFALLARRRGTRAWKLLDYFGINNPVFTIQVLFAQDKK